MIHRINLRLPEDLFETVKKAAAESGLPINQYITTVLIESLSNANKSVRDDSRIISDQEHKRGSFTTYRFHQEDVNILHQKAKALNLADTAYLRLLIRTKTFKRIDISTDDLMNYMSQSQRLIDSVTDFVDFIRTSGKGLVFEQDVKRILVMLDEIKTLHKEQIRITYADRRSVYQKMIEKIEEAV